MALQLGPESALLKLVPAASADIAMVVADELREASNKLSPRIFVAP